MLGTVKEIFLVSSKGFSEGEQSSAKMSDDCICYYLVYLDLCS